MCHQLAAEGIKVYAVVHPGSKRIESLKQACAEADREHRESLTIIECDMSEYSALPGKIAAFDSTQLPVIDAFFHLAWSHTVGAGRNDMHAQTDNIRYTLDAVDAASKLGCKVFIGAGSQAECGRHDKPLTADTPCFPEIGYGMAKLCAGQMSRVNCREVGIDHIWIRILSLYGPGDKDATMIWGLIHALKNGETPHLTKGEQIWDYLYAEDAAKAMILASKRGKSGAIYPLGSGNARPLRDYIEIIRDQVKPESKLGFGDIPYSPNQVMHLVADISELTKDTGWKPETSFEEGVRQMLTAGNSSF